MVNVKRATIGFIIFYIIAFPIVSILILLNQAWDLFGFLIALILVYLLSRFYYFKKEEPKEAVKEGFLVGLYWMIATIILDVILVGFIFVPELGLDFILKADWKLLIAYLLIPVFFIIGALTRKK